MRAAATGRAGGAARADAVTGKINAGLRLRERCPTTRRTGPTIACRYRTGSPTPAPSSTPVFPSTG
ncbi:hypothetical protein GCM10010350_74260 [Streptomyces galilaeus]|nr:hypothetical protein GCM10010350_74260 [Streptomyces galilaeus]